MVDFKKFGKYVWILPLIGGILALIAFFTPAAFYIDSISVLAAWMWGLLYVDIGAFSGISVVTDTIVLNLGLIGSTLVIGISIILLVSVYKYKKHDIKTESIFPIWMIGGLMLLVGMLFSIISLSLYTWGGSYPAGTWSVCFPNFGIIGVVIAALIVICGAFLFRKGNR